MKASIKALILGGLVAVAVILCGAPARAEAPARTVLANWLGQNTDLPASEVAIAGPDNVYALETLGAPEPTGEVVALVRTESLSPAWGAAHGFRSWDSHVLFDCRGGRLRVIRSAGYAEPNRQGVAKVETPDQAWFSPRPEQPAAKLLAAACDPAFAWPLRGERVPNAGPAEPPVARPAEPVPAHVAAAAPPAAEAAPATGPTQRVYAVQLGRGPHAEGAARLLRKAILRLGPAADRLAAVTEASTLGARRRYTARLEGFDTAAAARAACQKLILNQDACLVRGAPSLRQQVTVAAPAGGDPKTRAVASGAGGYAVQIGRGPFAEGARRALASARHVLGAKAARLVGFIEVSRSGPKRRYAALLTGLSSREDAMQACAALAAGGQGCLMRRSRPTRWA